MRFAIAIPQFYSDGEFDPVQFRTYLSRAEELGFDSAGSSPTARFAEQVTVVRDALAAAGRPAESFPIAKRVYVAIDPDPARARERMNTALAQLYGRRMESIEAAAVAGTADDWVRELRQVADAGAELILCTALFDQPEQMEQLAAAVIPELA
jgi:alkanesulfonate monooxygenase SsuD/methylene tetrahydromethanopterin reductase-like flavin-dependent oxidoreductase (luciferase family)